MLLLLISKVILYVLFFSEQLIHAQNELKHLKFWAMSKVLRHEFDRIFWRDVFF